MPDSNLIRSALERCDAWKEAAPWARSSVPLICALASPLSRHEIMSAWSGRPIRSDLVELWTTCGEAELFVEVGGGRYGLRLLSPAASVARTRLELGERSTELDFGDVVLGEFLGGEKLLVVNKNGEPLVAHPLAPRSSWHRVGAGLGEFLTSYVAAEGENFWEAG